MIPERAHKVVVDESEADVILVGFAIAKAGYLMLQRSYTFDAQDVELGMNRVYLEYTSQNQGDYVNFERVALGRDRLILTLDSPATQQIGSKDFEVLFVLDDLAYQRLRHGLRVLFEGLNVTLEPLVTLQD